jgi:hypothetical protein
VFAAITLTNGFRLGANFGSLITSFDPKGRDRIIQSKFERLTARQMESSIGNSIAIAFDRFGVDQEMLRTTAHAATNQIFYGRSYGRRNLTPVVEVSWLNNEKHSNLQSVVNCQYDVQEHRLISFTVHDRSYIRWAPITIDYAWLYQNSILSLEETRRLSCSHVPKVQVEDADDRDIPTVKAAEELVALFDASSLEFTKGEYRTASFKDEMNGAKVLRSNLVEVRIDRRGHIAQIVRRAFQTGSRRMPDDAETAGVLEKLLRVDGVKLEHKNVRETRTIIDHRIYASVREQAVGHIGVIDDSGGFVLWRAEER